MTDPIDIFARSRGGDGPAGPPRTGRAARSPPNNLRARRRPRLPARPRHVPRAVVAVLRDPAAVPHDVGVRVRLPRARGAAEAYIGFVVLGGAMTAFWLNVVWMMAGQLYWEKSQGNLELYFAAPDEPHGGAARHGRRRPRHELDCGRPSVLVDRRRSCSACQFEVEQWGLLVVVFLLTLTALYGLGMMLASLFLLWGREAFHMTNAPHRARLLRVRAQLPGRPPGRRSARSRSRRSRSPWAWTRCASWRSPASRTSPARRRPRWRR